MQTEFQIGDIVTIKNGTKLGKDSAPWFYEGIIGRVCMVWKDEYNDEVRLGVEWDFHDPKGHNCGGTCKHGYGWNVDAPYLKLLSTQAQIKETDLIDILAI